MKDSTTKDDHGMRDIIAQGYIEGKVGKMDVGILTPLSPISRNLWIQLPEDVRRILEQNGYTRYDVNHDTICIANGHCIKAV